MSKGLTMKPISVIKANLGIDPDGKTMKYFTKRCAEHMDKYVPYDEGTLAYDSRQIKTRKIIYNAPYAHYMYEGKVMGPNIPIMRGKIIVGYYSPKGKAKHYTGKDIDYTKSRQRGHQFAGPYWDKRMWSAEKEDVIEEVQNYMKYGR